MKDYNRKFTHGDYKGGVSASVRGDGKPAQYVAYAWRGSETTREFCEAWGATPMEAARRLVLTAAGGWGNAGDVLTRLLNWADKHTPKPKKARLK